MAKKNQGHDHDPQRCPTCRKLREIWMSNGFATAFQMLQDYYEGTLWPRVKKLWLTLSPDFRGREVLRMSDEAWGSIQKGKKQKRRS